MERHGKGIVCTKRNNPIIFKKRGKKKRERESENQNCYFLLPLRT